MIRKSCRVIIQVDIFYYKYFYYKIAYSFNCHSICKNYNTCIYEGHTYVFNLLNKFNVKCICNEGYYGFDCTHKYQCGNCPNEQCDGNGRCKNCSTGWRGNHCLDEDCESINMCGEHGLNFN